MTSATIHTIYRTSPTLAASGRSAMLIGLLGALLATGALFAGPTYADPAGAASTTVSHNA